MLKFDDPSIEYTMMLYFSNRSRKGKPDAYTNNKVPSGVASERKKQKNILCFHDVTNL